MATKNALAKYQDLAFPVPLSVAQKPKFLVNQSENLKRAQGNSNKKCLTDAIPTTFFSLFGENVSRCDFLGHFVL